MSSHDRIRKRLSLSIVVSNLADVSPRGTAALQAQAENSIIMPRRMPIRSLLNMISANPGGLNGSMQHYLIWRWC